MLKRNKASRTFKDTPAQNRKFARWTEKLEKEGFRSTGMELQSLRKGETLRSPPRWKYTYERRVEDDQQGGA